MTSSGINPTNSSGIYARAEETAYVAAEQLHRVLNGTAEEEVLTSEGLIPSIRKALVDNFYFRNPIAWVAGAAEEVFNQPRVFTNPNSPKDVTYWFAPAATSKQLIPMGGSPLGDDNWQPWVNGFDKGNPLISWSYVVTLQTQSMIKVPFSFQVIGDIFVNGKHKDPEDSYEYDTSKLTITFNQLLSVGDRVVVQFGVHGGIVPSLLSKLEALKEEVSVETERAVSSADRSEKASDTSEAILASISSLKGIFPDTEKGLLGTSNGEYFNVVSDNINEFLILYLNFQGVAVYQKTLPSLSAFTSQETLINLTQGVINTQRLLTEAHPLWDGNTDTMEQLREDIDKHTQQLDCSQAAVISNTASIINTQRLLTEAHPLYDEKDHLTQVREDLNSINEDVQSVARLSHLASTSVINNQRLLTEAHPLWDVTKVTSTELDIFAVVRASNFDRAYMLTAAFASDKGKTVLATSQEDVRINYISDSSEVQLLKHPTTIHELSRLVEEKASGKTNVTLHCNIGVALVPEMLSRKALKLIDNIIIIPEGTSVFTYRGDLLDKIEAFSTNAKAHGVKTVSIGLWSSVKIPKFISEGSELSQMPKRGVGFYAFDFGEIASNVRDRGFQGQLISASLYSGAIKPSVLTDGCFHKGVGFDNSKKSLVFFGSYTRPDIWSSKTNQIAVLTHLEKSVDKQKYNIIFKGHPSETSVNDWIKSNPSITSASYFGSFPYEIWKVVGDGLHNYNYKGTSYKLLLPQAAEDIYAVFSTSLYIEDSSTVKLLLGYNEVVSTGSDTYRITDVQHSTTASSIAQIDRWKFYTEASANFEDVYDFINN